MPKLSSFDVRTHPMSDALETSIMPLPLKPQGDRSDAEHIARVQIRPPLQYAVV